MSIVTVSGFGCCDLNEVDRVEFRGLWFVSVWQCEKFPRPSFRDATKTAESPQNRPYRTRKRFLEPEK